MTAFCSILAALVVLAVNNVSELINRNDPEETHLAPSMLEEVSSLYEGGGCNPFYEAYCNCCETVGF